MEKEIEEISVGEHPKYNYERKLLEEKNESENLKLEYERRIREENDKNDAIICKLIKDNEELQNKLREKNKLIHNWAEHAKTMRRKNNPFTKECKHFREMLNVFQQGVNMIDLSCTINEKVSKTSNKKEKEKLEKEIKELKDELMNYSFIIKQQKFKIDELKKELSQKPIKTKKEIKKEIPPTMLPPTPDSFEAGDSIASDGSLYQSKLMSTNISIDEKEEETKCKETQSQTQEVASTNYREATTLKKELTKVKPEKSSGQLNVNPQAGFLNGLSKEEDFFINSEEDSSDEIEVKCTKTKCKEIQSQTQEVVSVNYREATTLKKELTKVKPEKSSGQLNVNPQASCLNGLSNEEDFFISSEEDSSDEIEVKCAKTSLSNAGETFNLHESQCNLPNAGNSESLGMCVLERDSKSNKDILCVNINEETTFSDIEGEPKPDDVNEVLKYMKCPSPISFQDMHLSPIKIHSLKGKNGTERIENKQTGTVDTSYDAQNRSRHSHIARNLSFQISDNNCNSAMFSNISNEPTRNIFYNSSKTMKQPLIISSRIMGDDNLDRSPKVLSSSVAKVDKKITSSDMRNKDCSITHLSAKDESQQSKSTCENVPLNNDGPLCCSISNKVPNAEPINILPFHLIDHAYYCIPKSSALPCNDHSYSLSSINTQEEVVTPESCKTDHTSSSSKSYLNNVSITLCDESAISNRDIDISNKVELEMCTETKTGVEPQNPSNSQKEVAPIENSNTQLKNIKKPNETASVDNVNIVIPSLNYRTEMMNRKRQQVNIMPILRPNVYNLRPRLTTPSYCSSKRISSNLSSFNINQIKTSCNKSTDVASSGCLQSIMSVTVSECNSKLPSELNSLPKSCDFLLSTSSTLENLSLNSLSDQSNDSENSPNLNAVHKQENIQAGYENIVLPSPSSNISQLGCSTVLKEPTKLIEDKILKLDINGKTNFNNNSTFRIKNVYRTSQPKILSNNKSYTTSNIHSSPEVNDCEGKSPMEIEKNTNSILEDSISLKVDVNCMSKHKFSLENLLFEENLSSIQLSNDQIEFRNTIGPHNNKYSRKLQGSLDVIAMIKEDWEMDEPIITNNTYNQSCNKKSSIDKAVGLKNKTTKLDETAVLSKVRHSKSDLYSPPKLRRNVGKSRSHHDLNKTSIVQVSERTVNEEVGTNKLHTINVSKSAKEVNHKTHAGFENGELKKGLKQITNITLGKINNEKKKNLKRISRKTALVASEISNSYIFPKIEPLPDAMYKYEENLTKTNVDFTNFDINAEPCLLPTTHKKTINALEEPNIEHKNQKRKRNSNTERNWHSEQLTISQQHSPCYLKRMKANYFDNLPSKPLADNQKITSKLKNLPTVKKENASFQLSPIYQTNTVNKSKRTRKVNDRNNINSQIFPVTQSGLSSLSFEEKTDSTEIIKSSVSSPIEMKNTSSKLIQTEIANDRKQIDSHSQVTYMLPSPCLSQQTNIFNCDRLPSKYFDIPIQQSSTASTQLKSIDVSGESVLSHHQLTAIIKESETAQAEKNSNFIPKFYCEYENGVNTESKSFEGKIEGRSHEESKPIMKMQIQFNIHKQKTLNELIPQGEKVDVCGNILRTVIDKHKRDINIYKSRNNSEHRKLICTKPGKNDKKISEVMLEFFHGGRADMSDIMNTVDKIKDYSCSTILMGLFKAVSQEIDTCLNTSIGRLGKLDSIWILGIGRDTNLKNPQEPKLHQIVLAVIVIIIKVRNHKCQTPEQISNFMEEALEFIEKILLESINLNLHTGRDMQIFSTQLYTGLARLSGKLVRVRRFLFDMLYCFVNKSLAVFHTAMVVWPAVLPLKTIQNYFDDPLALSIFSAFKNGRNMTLQHLFRIPYNNPVYNSDDLFDMCVNHLHQEGVFEALFLHCKRNNSDWFTKRPMTLLIGMVKEWHASHTSDLTAATAIRLLCATARALNPAESQYILKPRFNLLRDILYDQKTPDWMAEIVVVNLCYLSRLNLSLCTDIISGWKPKQVSSEVIDQILLNIVSKQNWKKKSMHVYLNN